MINLHKYLAIIVMCCVGNAAWAAKEITVGSGGLTGYAGDPIQISNWEELQEELADAYDGEVYIAKTPQEMQSFEDDKTPKAFILKLNSVEIFSIINQPASANIADKIMELFGDFKKSDFKRYDQGVTMFAQDDKKGGYTLTAILLKGREKSNIAPSATNLISLKIDDKLTLGFPSGSEVFDDNKTKASGLNVHHFSVEVSLSPQDAATYITTQLSDANVRFRENSSDDSSSITFRRKDARASVTISRFDDETQTSLVLFLIYSKN